MYKKDYLEHLMSIPKIATKYNVSRSYVRNCLINEGVKLRSRKQSVNLYYKENSSPLKGRKLGAYSEERKNNIKKGRISWSEKNAKGVSLKPNGYLEYTTGKFKGRSVHIVIAECKIGRKLYKDEVVHHIDCDKTNNNEDNLQVLTRKEHARLHAKENYKNRRIKENGKFA